MSPSHVVHFPPSPTICTTFEVHSAQIYDRSPIQVGPNSCAMPARGCPGRTYYKDEEEEEQYRFCSRFLRAAELESKRDQAHPRALVDAAKILPLPQLIPDLTTSESEESDGFISPPPESTFSGKLNINDTVLLEPPTYLLPAFPMVPYVLEPQPKPRPIPSRPKARRSRSSSSSPTNRHHELDEDSGYVEDNELATTPTNRRSSPPSPVLTTSKKCRVATLRTQLCKALSFQTDASPDDGCLGGF